MGPYWSWAALALKLVERGQFMQNVSHGTTPSTVPRRAPSAPSDHTVLDLMLTLSAQRQRILELRVFPPLPSVRTANLDTTPLQAPLLQQIVI